MLLDLFLREGADMAQVTVDSTLYTVAEGERFARTFQLVAVSGDCADFLYVEEPFTLCTTSPK